MNQNAKNGFLKPKIKTDFDFKRSVSVWLTFNEHSSSQEVTHFTFLAFCIQDYWVDICFHLQHLET